MAYQCNHYHRKMFPQYVEAGTDDIQLIEQFQRGDQSVFDELVYRYQDRTYQLAQRFVPNHEDALDITQDAFIRAYQGLPDFQRKSQFYSWLYRITVNLCIDFLRKNARREVMAYESEDTNDLPMMNVADLNLAPPSKAIENKELFAYLRRAIQQLPTKQQEIFKLRYEDDLPLNKIAERLGR